MRNDAIQASEGRRIVQDFNVRKIVNGVFSTPFKAERKKYHVFCLGIVRALPPASIYFNH